MGEQKSTLEPLIITSPHMTLRAARRTRRMLRPTGHRSRKHGNAISAYLGSCALVMCLVSMMRYRPVDDWHQRPTIATHTREPHTNSDCAGYRKQHDQAPHQAFKVERAVDIHRSLLRVTVLLRGRSAWKTTGRITTLLTQLVPIGSPSPHPSFSDAAEATQFSVPSANRH